MLEELEYGADMLLSKEIPTVNNAVINLAEVVIELEKIIDKIQDKKEAELYVYDKNGNKVLL